MMVVLEFSKFETIKVFYQDEICVGIFSWLVMVQEDCFFFDMAMWKSHAGFFLSQFR